MIASSEGTNRRARSIWFCAISAGSVLAITDVLFTYSTGRVPGEYWPLYFVPPLALGLALGVVVWLVDAALRLRGVAGRLPPVALFAPLLVLGALRDDPRQARGVGGLLSWAAALLLLLLLVLPARRTAVRAGLLGAAILALAQLALLTRMGGSPSPRLLASTAAAVTAVVLTLWLAATLERRIGTSFVVPVLGLMASTALAGWIASTLGAWPKVEDSRLDRPVLEAPNLVVVVLDAVRADRLSCYGYNRPTTPNLDALARTATLFEHAYTTAPYTLSSHASLLTGLLPSEHGAHPVPFSEKATEILDDAAVDDYALAGEPEPETLGQRLGRQGFETGAIIANTVYMGDWTGLSRGFNYYDAAWERDYGFIPLALPMLLRADQDLYRRLRYGLKPDADEVTRAATNWLYKRGTRPFFLFINYMDVHHPLEPPPAYEGRFGRVAPVGSPMERAALALGEAAECAPDAATLEYRSARYDESLAFLDSQVGILLSHLRERGLFDKSVIVVTSDHGEFFGEHGLCSHKRALYEEVLRVPLLIKDVGQHSAGRESRRIGLHELGKALSGLGPNWSLAGQDGMRSPPPGPRVLAEFWIPQSLHKLNPHRFASSSERAVYSGPFKLILADEAPSELFDLDRDPTEGNNLLLSVPGDAANVIENHFNPLPKLANNQRRRPARAPERLPEAMRGLGYLP